MTNNQIRWIILGGTTALGLIFALVGAGFLYNQHLFMQGAYEVEATVIHIRVNSSNDGYTYQPTVRYEDFNGQIHERTTWQSSSGFDFDIGEKVDILYNHDYSDTIRMNGFFALWGFGSIFLIVALVPVAIGIAIFISMGNSKRRRRS